jgi:hypothetical protein
MTQADSVHSTPLPNSPTKTERIESSQQRGERLLAEYRAFRKAGVIPAEWPEDDR